MGWAVADTDICVMAATNSLGSQDLASTPVTLLTPNVVVNALAVEASYEAGVSAC